MQITALGDRPEASSTEDENDRDPDAIPPVLGHEVGRQEEEEVEDLEGVEQVLHEVWSRISSGAANRAFSRSHCVDLTKEDCVLGRLLAALELVHKLANDQDACRKGRHPRTAGAGRDEGDVAAEQLRVLAEGEALGADLDTTTGVLDHKRDGRADEAHTRCDESSTLAVLQRKELDRLARGDLGLEEEAAAITTTRTL